MKIPDPDPVLTNLQITYEMLEAVEDFHDCDLSEAKARLAQTIGQWGGFELDFNELLVLEKAKRHNRQGASHEPRLRLVRNDPRKLTPASCPPDPEDFGAWKIREPGDPGPL